MKKQSYSFPSVYEANGTNLNFVSKDLIDGLQIFDEKDQSYLIGNLALREGVSPNKLVNSSPYEIDYQMLLRAGVLLADYNNNRPLAITIGFPFSTFQVYKDIAKEMILKLDSIDFNPGTYSHNERTKVKTNIKQVEILPEMIGNIIGLRVGQAQASGNFFVVSLGYGTCEAVLSTESGIIHRTATSINGMQYAVDLFMRSLATKYYLGMKTEKQLDISFRQDFVILDREKINIVDLRKRILERYYKDIVSTGLRRSFTDSDFEKADRIYLTGGGALFPELIELFEKEFKQIAKVQVVDNPLTLTSEGYSLNSIMLTNGDESSAIGLDIGNANTVLTQYESENKIKAIAEEEEIVQEKIVVKTVLEEKIEEKEEESAADKILKRVEKKIDKKDEEKNMVEAPVVEEEKIEISTKETGYIQPPITVDEIVKTEDKKLVIDIPTKEEVKVEQNMPLIEEEEQIEKKIISEIIKKEGSKKTELADDYEPDFS